MRCGRADRLVDRYVDGRLDARAAAAVAGHAAGCPRCAARLAAARALAAGLAAEPAVRAPRRFADAVMDAVAREALRGGAGAWAAAPAYRRLGLSVLLGAAALTASFFVPRETWAAIGGQGGGAAVKQALDGADHVVRLALRSVEGRFR